MFTKWFHTEGIGVESRRKPSLTSLSAVRKPMLKGPPVTGVCSFCEEEVTGHPVMAGRSDLILTGGSAGDPLRAHYIARNHASSEKDSARTISNLEVAAD
jgi:hypothetical protein